MSESPVADNQGTKKIAPVEVPLSHPIADSGDQRPATYNRLLWVGLVISLLLALVVIFVLPELVKTPESPTVAVEAVQAVPAQPLESPWQDAQLAKARREAQDILKQILEKQQYLEQKQVMQWAKDPFAQAMAMASDGDTHYRQRNFPESLSAYSDALEALAVLEAQIPGIVESALQAGVDLLERGESVKAAEQFRLVLAIDPSHNDATKGLQRSENLDQVLQWVDQGKRLLEQGALDKAQAVFVQAVNLDPESRLAREAKARAMDLIVERDFNQAMSDGYGALESGQLAKAEQAFIRAAKLKPDDRSADKALTQARNRSAQQQVNHLLASAQASERAEQWQEAVVAYRQILSSDGSVIEARVGELRAKARAELDSTMDKLLGDPMRLATPVVFRNAQKTLRDASGIDDPGPRLQRQISELQAAIKQAASPVAVQLVSDNQTQVNLFKVGELGSFNNKRLMLKPGNYVAMGVRPGYRDVRVEFQVTGKQAVEPITVICSEPV